MKLIFSLAILLNLCIAPYADARRLAEAGGGSSELAAQKALKLNTKIRSVFELIPSLKRGTWNKLFTRVDTGVIPNIRSASINKAINLTPWVPSNARVYDVVKFQGETALFIASPRNLSPASHIQLDRLVVRKKGFSHIESLRLSKRGDIDSYTAATVKNGVIRMTRWVKGAKMSRAIGLRVSAVLSRIL